MNWSRLPFALSPLDRNALVRRSQGLIDSLRVESLRADSRTRIVVLRDRQIAVRTAQGDVLEGDGGRLTGVSSLISDDTHANPALSPWFDGRVVGESVLERARIDWLYLGQVSAGLLGESGEDMQIVAAILPRDVELGEPYEQVSWQGLRELADVWAPEVTGILVPALALANWHETARFCGRCGAPTAITQAGWSRTCTGCAAEAFPRMDPAVIMAIIDGDDRILLGNSARWPSGRYSTLAGFVEPGESLEDAVRREVLEESGIVVGAVHYQASQPWPFPASLMLGFYGRAQSTHISVDREEIREANWFTRNELRAACANGEVTLPSNSSIARALIDGWLKAEINLSGVAPV